MALSFSQLYHAAHHLQYIFLLTQVKQNNVDEQDEKYPSMQLPYILECSYRIFLNLIRTRFRVSEG